MIDLHGSRLAVAGGGAVGQSTALYLQCCGAHVTLFDPAPLGRNASGVAAGMLAPSMEAATDPASRPHFKLLKLARDRWPPFTALVGRPEGVIEACGSLWLGDDLLRHLPKVQALGVVAQAVTVAQAQALCPGLEVMDQAAVFCPQDWRIEPLGVLGSMQASFLQRGGRVEMRRLGVEDVDFDWRVIAGGYPDPATAELAPELAQLKPIKGQILRYPGGVGPQRGAIARLPGAYVAPSAEGALVGATMEFGRADLDIDPMVVSRLAASAEKAFPGLAGLAPRAMAGVRAETPDGLPMVGRSGEAGVILAAGMRRNGWLLAPLVAEAVAASVAGADFAQAAIFDPQRFGRQNLPPA